jgi:adenine/guanine phosphoribosyltransferase-like PRPP-binding protein
MKSRSFWDGMAMGAAAGLVLGVAILMSRRREPTPMERTRMVVGRTARQAVRRARGVLGDMAGKFSD